MAAFSTVPKDTQHMDLPIKMAEVSSQTFGLVNNVGQSWFKIFKPEFRKLYLQQLGLAVSKARSCLFTPVYPQPKEVFAWTQFCDINQVRVVIIGQCPYHNPDQACGLAFSVPKGCKVPPSLNNIYKELANDISGFVNPGHGDLTGWATQGVLLLNSCLTVCGDSAHNAHKGQGWETFTDAVLQHFITNRKNIVFILWGNDAKKKERLFIHPVHSFQSKHCVIKGGHPAPQSANNGHYFGKRYFSATNAYLCSTGQDPIDWSCLP